MSQWKRRTKRNHTPKCGSARYKKNEIKNILVSGLNDYPETYSGFKEANTNTTKHRLQKSPFQNQRSTNRVAVCDRR